MADRPNILFLMTDQMQVLEPDHPCLTPNLDQLAKRGIRFRNGYTPNAVCSAPFPWRVGSNPLCRRRLMCTENRVPTLGTAIGIGRISHGLFW